MNREIKFRAWDNDNNIFSYMSFSDLRRLSETIDSFESYFSHSYFVDNDEETNNPLLMQFTGLTDKNGKEIYEGDIVTIDKIASLYKKCPITIIGVIVFNFGKYEVQTKKVINKNFTDKTSIHFGLVVMDWIHLPEFNKTEVIGNIFENPELIK